MTKRKFQVGDKARSALNPDTPYVVTKVDARRKMTTIQVDRPFCRDLVFTVRTAILDRVAA